MGHRFAADFVDPRFLEDEMVNPEQPPRGDAQEIQPTGDEAAESTIGESVSALVTAVYRGIAEQVNPHNLNPLDFAVLRSFLRQEEWTTTALANILPVTASRISRVVTKLVDMGLISRRRLRDDRRVVMLSLTEEGSELTLKLHQRVQEYDSRLVEGISEEQLAEFADVAAKIIANYAAMERRSPE